MSSTKYEAVIGEEERPPGSAGSNESSTRMTPESDSEDENDLEALEDEEGYELQELSKDRQKRRGKGARCLAGGQLQLGNGLPLRQELVSRSTAVMTQIKNLKLNIFMYKRCTSASRRGSAKARDA